MSWEQEANKPMPRYTKEEPVVGRDWLLEEERQAATPIEQYVSDGNIENTFDVQSRTGPLETVCWKYLSEDEQNILECMVIAGHSVRRTAELLGLSRSVVHRMYQSALTRLEDLYIRYLSGNLEEE